ncbi:hypothetical protein OYT1_ch2100 [Ferriphaselus amnicola]|uniref:Uncharacterized protein n=1 Tax=Ferriphaselus amnicola TaxID=1188319 RepID=A0A2Z6GEN0_9PROT|nr:hypothetical protein [Ferriphaselus amnicola]BBE51625.1 hypothetical protein OYT1_ch2100 [Ferriphaselus amnicola]
MLFETSELEVSGSSSIIGFTTEGGGNWKVWDRYLTIDGKKAFHIGNVCETCSFFFERLEGANKSVNSEVVVDALNKGVRNLAPSIVQALALIVPDGKYKLLLQDVRPRLVKPGEESDYFADEQVALWGVNGFWGMPHFPKTEYYRLRTKSMKEGRGLFEFLVPMFPHNWLDQRRLAEYEAAYNNNEMPSAVSISILDIKSPADWDREQDITSHWCLAHYLIDGHHKAYAAAKSGKPFTLISFLAVSQGISSEEEITEVVRALNDLGRAQ